MPESYETTLPGVAFRVQQATKRLEALESWRIEVDRERATDAVVIENLVDATNSLSGKVDGLIKALVGFALSIAASAVIFAMTILAATGKI